MWWLLDLGSNQGPTNNRKPGSLKSPINQRLIIIFSNRAIFRVITPKVTLCNFPAKTRKFTFSVVTLHAKVRRLAWGPIMWSENSKPWLIWLLNDGAGHYSIREWFLHRNWLNSLAVLLTAGSDPELAVIDFDCNSSSTCLTASRRSWSVSSWQRDSCSWWRNALKSSRSFISA